MTMGVSVLLAAVHLDLVGFVLGADSAVLKVKSYLDHLGTRHRHLFGKDGVVFIGDVTRSYDKCH